VTVVDGLQIQLTTSPNAGDTNGSSAQCPAGDVVLGGGWSWAGTQPSDTSIVQSQPIGGTSWTVTAINNSTVQTPILFAVAICGS
jgi:hypothetical protein